jgi:NAD(P) transhydrogenase subunit alpha
MVEAMRPGSLVIDLAVEAGGNCELSKAGEVRHNGVRILGFTNLAATLPHDASVLYARNVVALTGEFVAKGSVNVDTANEIIAGTLLTHGGAVVHAPTRDLLSSG